MKVLMINVVCGIRSTGRICTDLATELEKQGHEVKIAYGREQVPQRFQKYAVRIGSDFDVKLHGIKARVLDAAGFGSKRATEKFIKWVKEYDPDVIHLHNIHGYYINVEILFQYLKTCGKKIIWTLHDCWSFTGHCAYFDYVNCSKWKTRCKNCSQKTEYPSRIGPDRSKQNYLLKKELFTGIKKMVLVTPSQWLAGLISESYMREYPTAVIYNGIDTQTFKPMKSGVKERYGCRDKKIVLGVAAVWDKRKGLGSFIELAKHLDCSYQIILVGVSQKQIEKLPPNIIGIERTNSVEELAELYTAADVFVNPTLEDNYPTTNIEAIACGTPVITYETGGSPESAKMYGVSVHKKNIAGLVKAITNISKIKPGEIDIDYKSTVQKYIELYEEI
jgi:putative colanic acid biosynthesis glycosyltransferase